MIGRSIVSVAALAWIAGVSFAAPAPTSFMPEDASLAIESSSKPSANVESAVRSACCGEHEHNADGEHPENGGGGGGANLEATVVEGDASDEHLFYLFPTANNGNGVPSLLAEDVDDSDSDSQVGDAVVVSVGASPAEATAIPEPKTYTRPQETQLPDDAVCFPAAATVELEDGSVKRMDAVAIGDRVKIGTDTYSDVFMFTHKMSDSVNVFVELNLASGDVLRLTPGHYMYANQAMTAAKDVVVGDMVELGSGAHTTVSSISGVSDTGLFNPQTLHGDLIVDNVRASTYTTAVTPSLAHTLLSPLRMMFNAGMAKDPSFGLLENGAGPVASML